MIDRSDVSVDVDEDGYGSNEKFNANGVII